MRITNPSVEIMRTGFETNITPEQHIEKVGRTCYKSEDKITETSAAKFVSGLVKRGHEAMIEHFNLIFGTDPYTYDDILNDWIILMTCCDIETNERLRAYMKFTNMSTEGIGECTCGEERHIVSGNMRAWRDYAKACVEAFGLIPQYLHGVIRNYPIFFPEFQDYVPAIVSNDVLIPMTVSQLLPEERRVHQNITVKIVCDRGVSHEIVRHRVASFAQESTRYCNYALEKFGGEITVIRPSWCNEGDAVYDIWKGGCVETEESYFAMLNAGAAPQEARGVLPNSLKTEIIVTMNPDGWEHFFHLRCAPDAQPDMREIAIMTQELFDVVKVYG